MRFTDSQCERARISQLTIWRQLLIRIVAIAACLMLVFMSTTGCVSINFGGFNAVTGKGNPERFEFKTGEITEIRVEFFCNVELYSVPSDTVTLEIQPNLMEYVRVEESGGVLTVRSTRPLSNWSNVVATLTVSTPVLESLSFSGAGRFTAHDIIAVESLSLHFSGAADGYAEMDVGKLFVNVSGAGMLNLSGMADTADIRLSGAGDVNALELQTRDAGINLAGAGLVKISCSDNLSIAAAGVGSVEYRGTPSLDLNRGGLVSVTRVD